jgi:hypothetical protein
MCYLSKVPQPIAFNLLEEISCCHVRYRGNICAKCGLSVSARDPHQCKDHIGSNRFTHEKEGTSAFKFNHKLEREGNRFTYLLTLQHKNIMQDNEYAPNKRYENATNNTTIQNSEPTFFETSLLRSLGYVNKT